MGEILGVGCTHRPVMLRRNEDWTFMMKASLADPAMPDEMKNPARWPAPLREELGNDWGTAAAARAREVYRRHFAEARQALDDFKPDLIVMWGDDQYENFQEDIVPPFAVLAYDDQDIQPWAHRRSPDNPWNEPADKRFGVRGHKAAGKYLASRLLESGIDIAYAIQAACTTRSVTPSRTPCCCSTTSGAGLTIRWCPFSGQLLRAASQCGTRATPAASDEAIEIRDLDPPSPNPHRCMEVGAATARIWPTARGGWR